MPTERYIKLNSFKKRNMEEALERCLSTINLNEINISDIVREADICRGTFYTYFSDKEDAVHTYAKSMLDKCIYSIKEIFLENDGDFFKSVMIAYEGIKKFLQNDTNRTINTNILSSVSTTTLFSNITDFLIERTNFAEWCVNNTDIMKNYTVNLKGIQNIIEMLMSIIFGAIVEIEMNDLSQLKENEIDESVRNKIEIIKRGISSRD